MQSGDRIDTYRLEQLLGEGGAARVFAAIDERTGAPVALKVLRHAADAHPEAYQRMLREAAAVRRLAHPAVVAVHQTGLTSSHHPYLVMDRIDGISLRQRLRDGPVPAGQAWAIVRDAAATVHAAHRAGILHRDLTPGNILLEPSGRVLLTDFGLARTAGDVRLTRSGDALGTPAYMAPEQWWGATVDARTDLYGLGAILYEALLGRPPWDGEDAGAMLHQLATAEGPRIDADALSPAVRAFLRRCLARSPGDRPIDAEAFILEGDTAFAAFLQTGADATGSPAAGMASPASATASTTCTASSATGTASDVTEAAPDALEATPITIAPGNAATIAFDARPVPRRVLSSGEAMLPAAAVMASLAAIGYRGVHNPLAWFEPAGPWMYILLIGTTALLLTLGRPAARVLVPFFPVTIGALGAWMGFGATMEAVAQLAPEWRFIVFHVGLAETLTNLYVGAGLAAALAAALVWRPNETLKKSGSDRQDARHLFLSGTVVLAAALTGDPGALAVALLAAALLVRGTPTRDTASTLASLAAVAALVLAATCRHLGGTAELWAVGRSRVDRANALAAAYQARPALAAAFAWSLASISLAGRWRPMSFPRRFVALGAAGTATALLALGSLIVAVRLERRPLWDELAPRFSLWSELDPPQGAGRGAARIGPTLQLGRRLVALDGEILEPAAALEGASAAGPLVIAQALAPRLRPGGDGPDLVLACDRSLPWAMVARALAVARDLGVRKLDVLYQPGPAPVPRASMPAEAAFVLPQDLRAVEVRLLPGGDPGAIATDLNAPFERVAEALRGVETPALAP